MEWNGRALKNWISVWFVFFLRAGASGLVGLSVWQEKRNLGRKKNARDYIFSQPSSFINSHRTITNWGYMYVTHIYSLLGFRLVCLGLASLLRLGGIRTHWARKAGCAGRFKHTHAALLFSWAGLVLGFADLDMAPSLRYFMSKKLKQFRVDDVCLLEIIPFP